MKDYDSILSRMAALCSVSEHCESEIREKLQKAAMPAHDIQRVIDALYDDGYLDTARYCRAFSRDKLRFAHWGRIKIQQALRMKGLPDTDIRQALNALDEELGDEYRRILKDALEQKNRTLHDEDDYTRRGKLIRFAASRGFTPDEILNALDERPRCHTSASTIPLISA